MRTSSARRIYAVLKRAHEDSTQSSAMVAWANVFSIAVNDNSVPPAAEDAVMDLLRDLRSEVDGVEKSVRGTEFADAVGPIADTVRQLTATSQIHASWATVKANFLRSDFLAGWKWASISLPSIEDHVTTEALSDLRAQLSELEQTIANPNVPDELRKVVDRQIRRIRAALSRYDVSGTEPLAEAVSQMTGEVLRDHTDIQSAVKSAPEVSRPILKRFGQMWNTAATMSDQAEKVQKGIALVARVVHPLLEHFGGTST